MPLQRSLQRLRHLLQTRIRVPRYSEHLRIGTFAWPLRLDSWGSKQGGGRRPGRNGRRSWVPGKRRGCASRRSTEGKDSQDTQKRPGHQQYAATTTGAAVVPTAPTEDPYPDLLAAWTKRNRKLFGALRLRLPLVLVSHLSVYYPSRRYL